MLSLHHFWKRKEENEKDSLLLTSAEMPLLPIQTLAAANEVIKENYNHDTMTPKLPRKRPLTNERYTPEETAKIAKATINCGPAKAAREMSKILNKSLSESTCRSIKKRYLDCQRRTGYAEEINSLAKKSGRPTVLPDGTDQNIRECISRMREKGLVINNLIVRCIGAGIADFECPSLLLKNGGIVELGRCWARSVLRRMNFTKRQATKSAKADVANVEFEIAQFQQKLRELALELATPPEMIVNFDEMGCKFVPVGKWTMARRGDKQVKIDGIDDKREITVTLASSMAGELLPFQVIYAGTTDRCHKNLRYPDSFSITHSSNHWAVDDTFKHYVDDILVPYYAKARQALELAEEAPGICVLDMYKVHQTETAKAYLLSKKIVPCFVPPCLTGYCQPADQLLNKFIKDRLRNQFQSYFAASFFEDFTKLGFEAVDKIDTRASIIKPKHAEWLVSAFEELQAKKELIFKSWQICGILFDTVQVGSLENVRLPDADDDDEDDNIPLSMLLSSTPTRVSSLATPLPSLSNGTPTVIDVDSVSPLSDELQPWMTILGQTLLIQDRIAIEENGQLSDRVMDAGQLLAAKMLNQPYQTCLLASTGQYYRDTGLFHVHYAPGHWVLSIVRDGKIRLYDSLFSGLIARSVKNQLRQAYGNRFAVEGCLDVDVMSVQQQKNSVDCGVFCLGFLFAHATGQEPATILYFKGNLRKHLIDCLESKTLVPFPAETIDNGCTVKTICIEM